MVTVRVSSETVLQLLNFLLSSITVLVSSETVLQLLNFLLSSITVLVSSETVLQLLNFLLSNNNPNESRHVQCTAVVTHVCRER